MQQKVYRGRNTVIRTDGTTLIVEMDLTKAVGKSSGGKSTLIATTGGNDNLVDVFDGEEAELLKEAFPNGIFFGQNLYTPIPRSEWDEATIKADEEARAARSKATGKAKQKFA
jgi:hypothetical protein